MTRSAPRIDELETLSPATLAGRHMADFRHLLSETQQGVPYYAHRAMVDPDGVVTREDLRLIAPSSKLGILEAQRRHPPFGGLLNADAGPLRRIYRYPNMQVLALTDRDLRAQLATYQWALSTVGLTADDVVTHTFQFSWVPAGTLWDSAFMQMGSAAVPGGAGSSEQHASSLAHLGVSVIVGFPTFLARIGEEFQKMDATSDPRLVVLAGELTGHDDRAALSEAFGGAEIREVYGTAECGMVAAACESNDDLLMHINPRILCEVRDPISGEPVPEGSSGELFLTPLDFVDAPVLRFRTGDVTETHTEQSCACGRSTMRIGRIIGRAGSLVRLKGLFVGEYQIGKAKAASGFADAASRFVVQRVDGLDSAVLEVEVHEYDQGRIDDLQRSLRTHIGMAVEVKSVAADARTPSPAWFVDLRRDEGGLT